MNKTPIRLLGTEGHRIQRVACGSSHSVAWAETNIVCDILDDAHRFSPNCDPLGASLVMQKHPYNPPIANVAKIIKDQRPSLVRTVLQIHSKTLQRKALQKILKTIEIYFSRKMIMHCLKSVKHKTDIYTQKWTNEMKALNVESIINLLKLALCGHLQKDSVEVLEHYLKDICYKNVEVCWCYLLNLEQF